MTSIGPVTQLSCGSFYTAAVTRDGSLYTWGSMSSPLGTDSEEETKSESFLEEKEQDTKTTSLRYSKAPIFGAFHRRIRKMPLVKQHIDRSRSSSTPRKVHALFVSRGLQFLFRVTLRTGQQPGHSVHPIESLHTRP